MSDRGRYDHTGGRKGACTAAGVLCLFLALVHAVWVAESVRQFGLSSALRQFIGIDPTLTSDQTDRGHLVYAAVLLLLGVLALLRTPAARGAILLAGWLLIYGVVRFAATSYDDPRYLDVAGYGDSEIAILTTQGLTLLVAIVMLIVLAPAGRPGRSAPGTRAEDTYADPFAASAGSERAGPAEPQVPQSPLRRTAPRKCDRTAVPTPALSTAAAAVAVWRCAGPHRLSSRRPLRRLPTGGPVRR